MLKKEYYYLVAGLPDLFFNENKLTLNTREFRSELQHQLSQLDYKLVEYLFLPSDNQNLLNILFEQNKPHFGPGIYTKQELDYQLSPENEKIELPEYMLQFLEWMKNRESKEFTVEVENIITALFYEYALRTKNQFLRDWFKFELHIKNISTALNCLKYKYELSEHLLKVEQDSVFYSLLLNERLKPEFFEDELPFNDQIFKVVESNNSLIEKEKLIDKIKWEYLDENTFFHYFTIEKVCSYLIKLQITERWMKLDAKTGKELLDKLINELKTSYEFPAEFSLNK